MESSLRIILLAPSQGTAEDIIDSFVLLTLKTLYIMFYYSYILYVSRWSGEMNSTPADPAAQGGAPILANLGATKCKIFFSSKTEKIFLFRIDYLMHLNEDTKRPVTQASYCLQSSLYRPGLAHSLPPNPSIHHC